MYNLPRHLMPSDGHVFWKFNFEQKWVGSLFLGILLLFAFVLRVVAALHYPNVDYPDETYETREPAHHLAFSGPWIASWEYRVGARSWVFPGFLAAIMRATAWMGHGADGYLLGITLILSLLSLSVIWFSFAWSYRVFGATAAVIASCCCAFWFELVYFAPKTLNEVVAAHLLLPALCVGALERKSSVPRKVPLLTVGVLCGLSVALRMQLLPAVFCAGVYFCWPHWKKSAVPFLAGMLVPVLCFGIIDYFTWGHLFYSYIANFSFNIFKNRAILSGVHPWYWYFFQLFRHAGPIPLLALVGVRRSPFLGVMALAVLIPHSFIQHKDYRYIYTVVPIMITLAGMGLAEIVPPLLTKMRMAPSAIGTFAVSIALMLAVSTVYWIFTPKWRLDTGGLAAFQNLSRDSGVCGVAIVKDNWWDYGGYTYLHHSVPIYLLATLDEVYDASGSFNVAVTSAPFPRGSLGFEQIRCGYGVCTYRRPGSCAPTTVAVENEVNKVLIRLDE